MDVRLFEGVTHFYALATDGGGAGYTFTRDFLSRRSSVPPLAELRKTTLMVERARSRRLLNSLNRFHPSLDLRYGLPLRTIFRIERRTPDPFHPLKLLAVFLDMPATGVPDEPRLLAYEYEAATGNGRLTFLRLPAVLKHYRPARESEYRALKTVLENEKFPALSPRTFARPLRSLEGAAI